MRVSCRKVDINVQFLDSVNAGTIKDCSLIEIPYAFAICCQLCELFSCFRHQYDGFLFHDVRIYGYFNKKC